MAGYWTTDSDDPAHLYHDVLVAIDEKRRLNNGQPSLWASLYDQFDLAPGVVVSTAPVAADDAGQRSP
jgi:protein-L-isoaspartate(D-aspartate) O-methyltransferase